MLKSYYYQRQVVWCLTFHHLYVFSLRTLVLTDIRGWYEALKRSENQESSVSVGQRPQAQADVWESR